MVLFENNTIENRHYFEIPTKAKCENRNYLGKFTRMIAPEWSQLLETYHSSLEEKMKSLKTSSGEKQFKHPYYICTVIDMSNTNKLGCNEY